MILNITAKNLNLSESLRREIEEKTAKISKLLPYLANDLSEIKVNLKSRKSNSYRIKLTLFLPGQFLAVRMRKETIGEVIKSGFHKLTEQVKHYRERHFKSLSRYPGRGSIRRGEEIWMRTNWQ